MASGIINGKTSNPYIDSKIEWSSSPLNADNKSEVTASLYYRRNNSWTGTPTSGTGTFGITIDGQSGSDTFSLTIPNGGAWVKAVTVKKTVSHNSDGTRSITISASGSIPVASLTSTTCEGTATLDNIPRQATMTSAIDFNDEGNPSFTFTNPANGTMSCWLEPNPTSDHLCERTLSGTSGTFTWNLTEAERKQLRKACKGKSCTCRIGLYSTVGGVTYTSYLDKTLSIVNGNPTFTADQISYEDTSDVKDITDNPQHIVQNQSNLSVTITEAIANKEATISRYDVTVNGVTKTATPNKAVEFGKINSSKDVEISVTVTDSRGNTTTVKKTVTVFAWALPIFTASLERVNNYEEETHLTVDASISSVNGKNTIRIWFEYAEKDGIYSQPIEIANNTPHTVELNKDKSYDFNIVVEDAFDYSSKQYVVDKGKFPLFIDTRKNAVGINDFPAEGEALRVTEGIANFVDGVKISGSQMPDFVVEQDTDGIWIYRKWESGIAECWGVTDDITQTTDFNWNVMSSNTATPAIDYPFTFKEPPVVSPNVHTHNMNFWLATFGDGSTTQTPTYQIIRGKDVSEVTFKLGFYVFGKYK